MVYQLKHPVSVAALSDTLGLPFSGPALTFDTIGRLEQAQSNCLVFAKAWPSNIVAGATYIAPIEGSNSASAAHIQSSSPRRDFIKALEWLDSSNLLEQHVTPAVIHPSARIGANVVIEPNCVIEAGVVIEPNAVILAGTRIGEYSRIRANATIGSDGFGFERDPDGTVYRFIHLGGVVIGKDAEIGANTCIARGTLGNTIIEDGAKIDNLVHISHNVRVGARAFVIAGAEVSGGCQIGADSWIGPNVCIKEQISIGEGALVGIGSTVIRSIGAGEVHAGNPAKLIKKREQG